MKAFIPKKNHQIGWQDRHDAIELVKVIRKGYPTEENDREKMRTAERFGVEKSVRLLRDIACQGAKTLHLAAYMISRAEELAYKDEELKFLFSAYRTEQSPMAAISELGILLSELNSPLLERMECAMLCTPELFNADWIGDPLQDYTEEFE